MARRRPRPKLVRPAGKQSATRKTISIAQPRLGLVRARRPAPRRSAAPPTPSPSFPQRAGASARQIVLFEMVRARAAFQAAIQGLAPGAANEPVGGRGWSAREIVLHLVTRDQARLRELEAILRGATPSWKGAEDPSMARINAEMMEPLKHHDWEEALRLLHLTRQQLLEAVETVPEEPEEVWTENHGFGWMLRALPAHDRHHAETIKRWRATRGA